LFIADDHSAFCERLVGMLTGIEGVEIVGRAGNASGAIKSIQKTGPDIVLLDIRMPPGAGGFDVLRTVKKQEPWPVVIMLTAFSSEEYRKKCMAMGADYYFDKSSDLKNMLAVIKQLVSGPLKERDER